jgi:DNA replication and repair protein RecF
MTTIQHIALTDFRSYTQLDFTLGGQSLYLYGPNGAGKTNLLEAISVLNPGKGLRGAAFAELGRRMPDESPQATKSRLWGVVARLGEGEEAVTLGTGADPRDPGKRLVRIDQQALPAARLLEHLRLVWLTPAQDRIFIEARSERLRFFDRLVYAANPSHATQVHLYEKALRERLRLLTDGRADPTWLSGLEARLVEAGTHMITARRNALRILQDEVDAHQSAFPKAVLSLTGDQEAILDETELEGFLRTGYAAGRNRDAAAGRSLFGPHRTDLQVLHAEKNRPAAECSTGEQKALVLNMILAQSARLSRNPNAPKPVILLDEVAAHLDTHRRHALFDETTGLGLQTVFTGTDLSLFDGLKSRALGVRVEASQLTEFSD